VKAVRLSREEAERRLGELLNVRYWHKADVLCALGQSVIATTTFGSAATFSWKAGKEQGYSTEGDE